MPQLEQVEFFISQLFWLGVFFVILFTVLTYLTLPKIRAFLNQRDDIVKSHISKQDELINGVSLENAAYFENNLYHDENHKEVEPEEVVIDDISVYEEKSNDIPEADASQDEDIPQLFSEGCLIYTSPSPRDMQKARMPS